MKAILISLIRFYRGFISPLKPPMCRFYPTCSHYALESIESHGVIRGALMAAWRILRCNPFVPGGYDPVPDGNNPNGDADAPLGPAVQAGALPSALRAIAVPDAPARLTGRGAAPQR